MMIRLFSPLALLLALLVSGCYWDRFTHSYDSVTEMNNEGDGNAILEESGRDIETIARNEKRLKELATDEEPGKIMASAVGIAFMGQVKLSGYSIAEGAETLRAGLAPYIKNPVVSITVKEIVSETATIAGACARPGVFGISNSTRLADFYAMAGSSAQRLFNGVDVDVADLEHSMIIRKGEILPVDFRKAIEQGDTLHNIRIRKGDYVFVAQRMEASVTICGEVKNPHKRLFEPGMGLIETLTVAGWMQETHWKHVIIIRDGLAHPRFYKVDVDGILAGKCRNVVLKAGDIIYVPKDSLSEYNVFVRKLLPTAQIFSLIAGRASVVGVGNNN